MPLGNWEGGGCADAACHEARASEPISRETCLSSCWDRYLGPQGIGCTNKIARKGVVCKPKPSSRGEGFFFWPMAVRMGLIERSREKKKVERGGLIETAFCRAYYGGGFGEHCGACRMRRFGRGSIWGGWHIGRDKRSAGCCSSGGSSICRCSCSWRVRS